MYVEKKVHNIVINFHNESQDQVNNFQNSLDNLNEVLQKTQKTVLSSLSSLSIGKNQEFF